MYDAEEKVYKILSENLKGRDHLRFSGTEEDKIKRWMWTIVWLRLGTRSIFFYIRTACPTFSFSFIYF